MLFSSIPQEQKSCPATGWLMSRHNRKQLLLIFSVASGGSPSNSLEVLTPEVPGERDRGNCITSLQLHPKGWATLLRCSSNTDDQEVKVRRSALHKYVEWFLCKKRI